MTWTTKLVALGAAAAGGVIVLRCIPTESRHRMTQAVGDWITKKTIERVERLMASLPESAPPKLIASILPKLQAQNEQILAMLQEQNELLRRQQHKTATAA
jgi:hypothetical protein